MAPEPEAADRPKVLLPPPLILFGPLIVGVVVNFAYPWSFLPPGWLPLLIGLSLFVVGLSLMIASGVTLVRAHTDSAFRRPTSAIVTHGPYRLSRNPIYLGATVLFVGVAVAVNALGVAALLPVAILGVRFGAILPEERYLERKFGEEYLAYKRKVRRWV